MTHSPHGASPQPPPPPPCSSCARDALQHHKASCARKRGVLEHSSLGMTGMRGPTLQGVPAPIASIRGVQPVVSHRCMPVRARVSCCSLVGQKGGQLPSGQRPPPHKCTPAESRHPLSAAGHQHENSVVLGGEAVRVATSMRGMWCWG